VDGVGLTKAYYGCGWERDGCVRLKQGMWHYSWRAELIKSSGYAASELDR